jgi:hypothetical protein
MNSSFTKWLFSWWVLRRGLFLLACLATLIALFYAEENWRGRRAWEKCRRELEAKGAVLDWTAYIPAPVPDEQNIFKAAKMTEWFVRKSWAGALSGDPPNSGTNKPPFTLAPHQAVKGTSVLVAEVEVITPEAPLPLERADAVLRFETRTGRAEAAKMLKQSLGPCVEGATGYVLVARPPDQIHPLHLVVQADTAPPAKELGEFLYANASYLQIAPHGSNRFHVWLKNSVYSAADYLALSQPAVPDLDLLRKALERPCARMDGDYERPFESPLPNFVRLRTVAQMLAQRAQCYLLQGQPEAAWHELAPVRDMCRLLDGKPTSDCPTLVAAMIDVAISGLYTSIIKDGLRLGAWREPELAAIQKQLTEVRLLSLVRASLNAERAATCRTFECYTRGELKKLFSFGDKQHNVLDNLKDPTFLLITFAPRGWMYQNMCAGAPLGQRALEALDLPNNQVLPAKLEDIERELLAVHARRSPYRFLAAIAMPNFAKALQTMARNQTLANEAYIACGLERYRLARGQYLETLEGLVPQFADKIPDDLISGQPLKYRRTAEGGFLLYSVGWNEKNDGGVAGKTITEGDWVWE